MGRFGWQAGDAGVVEQVAVGPTLRCPTDDVSWTLGFGADGGELSPVPTSVNWLAKQLDWRNSKHQTIVKSTISLASAFMLWESSQRELSVSGSITQVIYANGTGLRC